MSIPLLSPDDYLKIFKTPNSVLSSASCDEVGGLNTFALEEIIESKFHFSDTDKERQNKENALQSLREIVTEWMKKCLAQDDHYLQTQNLGTHAGVNIFGSYKLLANKSDGDIDVVLLVPKNIRREDHFNQDLMRKLKANQGASDVLLVAGSMVPLLKCKLLGVQFDILMSNVSDDMLNDLGLLGDIKMLSQLDEKSLRSLNGIQFCRYVETKFEHRIQTFRIFLRAVKLWAKNRCLYSQIQGFFGGIGMAILVVKIMQLYPNYGPLKLLQRFFFIYSRWPWTDIPVLVEQIREQPWLLIQQWHHDQRSDMSVITPTYPCTNAAFNVSKSSLKAISEELRRAQVLLTCVASSLSDLGLLFANLTVFAECKNFIQVSVMSKNRQDFLAWRGIVQSKFKKLIKLIEDNQKSEYLRLRPYSECFERNIQNYKACINFYIGLQILSITPRDESIHIYKELRQFVEAVQKLNTRQQSNNIKIRVVPRYKLHPELFKGNQIPAFAQRKDD